MNKTDSKMAVQWRLRHMLVERDIRKNVELQRRLKGCGYEISQQQLGRLINNTPERLNMDFIVALCLVLKCDISDLIKLDVSGIQVNATEGCKTTPEVQSELMGGSESNVVSVLPKRANKIKQSNLQPENITRLLPVGFDDL